ncbi:PREDICTED: plasminogen activator inhibitor 1 [Papilio polytes]|uniref:plasminogen activator inhibitor 1 n=1 Tax=Papilio polytes TaxID=76194 RepID=UPI00067631A6|nr:PREDICTED: plasminogen activator inhibitor 1 [Papilio polytes]XP_013142891.1 PREDICTED: plasminogen activator inhibitor 1 [Papilio polytes]
MQIFFYLSFVAFTQLSYAQMDIQLPSFSSFSYNEESNRLVNSINEFGFKLLSKMMKKYPDKNIVISPASISCLLAMTLLGSVGRSYDELAGALGFSEDILLNRQNHELFGEFLRHVNSDGTWSKTIFADAVFVDSRSQLRDAYRAYLARVYGGEVLTVNFTDTMNVKEIINDWVSTQTKGQIDNFLKESLPVSTKVVLLSALYFSGQWARPFLPEHTRKMTFTRGKDKINEDLMLNLGQFNYIHSVKDGLHMIAFQYNDSSTTMYALKPRMPNELSLTELMERLDYSKIDSLINQMTELDTVVRFPKMEIKSDVNLESNLKELGIRSMFDPREANFALMIDTNTVANRTVDEILTRINEGNVKERRVKNIVNNLMNPGVYVDSVMHEVKIKIDEYGTEAVAATSSILARTAEQFYADSPFFMFIRNEKTKLITFSALVFDPTV